MRVKNFLNETFGEVHVLTDAEGGIWFLANDVAQILGYRRERDAILAHTSSDDRMQVGYGTDDLGDLWSGNDRQRKTFINESGLYCMIFGSKMPAAQEFKRWVAKEVLPAIRKTGGYIQGQEDLAAEDRKALEETIRELAGQVERAVAGKKKLQAYLVEEEARVFGLQEKLDILEQIMDRIPQEALDAYKRFVVEDIPDRYAVSKNGFRMEYKGYWKKEA